MTLYKTQVQVDKDFNVKPDTPNLKGKKVRNNLEHTGTATDILNRTAIAQTLRSTINKWNLIKLMNLIHRNK